MEWKAGLIGLAAMCLTACSVTYVVPSQAPMATPVVQSQLESTPIQPAPEAYVAAPEPVYAAASEPSVSVQAEVGTVILPAGVTEPGDGYVWVNIYPLSAEIAVPGFWRLRVRSGYRWVEGRWLDEYGYLPGYWEPLKTRGRNWVWVPGHWAGKYWIQGRWRPASKAGYVWVPGHWDRYGEWIEGHWRPTRVRKGLVWVPGFWLSSGAWKAGFWRPEHKSGYLWIPGHYNGLGRWVPGAWMAAPPKHHWIRGYWDAKGEYYPGRLQKIEDDSAEFVRGHYDHKNRWVPDRWVRRQQEEKQQVDAYRSERNQADEADQVEQYRRTREQAEVGDQRPGQAQRLDSRDPGRGLEDYRKQRGGGAEYRPDHPEHPDHPDHPEHPGQGQGPVKMHEKKDKQDKKEKREKKDKQDKQTGGPKKVLLVEADDDESEAAGKGVSAGRPGGQVEQMKTYRGESGKTSGESPGRGEDERVSPGKKKGQIKQTEKTEKGKSAGKSGAAPTPTSQLKQLQEYRGQTK